MQEVIDIIKNKYRIEGNQIYAIRNNKHVTSGGIKVKGLFFLLEDVRHVQATGTMPPDMIYDYKLYKQNYIKKYIEINTDHNTVFDHYQGKALPVYKTSGYMVVQILDNKMRLHRMVWLLSGRDLPVCGKMDARQLVINHIDGDRCNNHLENLELITLSANAKIKLRDAGKLDITHLLKNYIVINNRLYNKHMKEISTRTLWVKEVHTTVRKAKYIVEHNGMLPAGRLQYD